MTNPALALQPSGSADKGEYIVLTKAAPEPGGLQLTRRRIRPLRVDEVLVRVHRAAICGTDLHIFRWNTWAARSYQPPFALGHELSGEVVAVGEDVTRVNVGDRVSLETHLACGYCSQCKAGRGHTCLELRTFGKLDQGAFAEYTIVPQTLLRAVPTEVLHKHACLMEPLGIALRAIHESAVGNGNLLVTGCGPIGLMSIAIARHLGARSIVATDFSRSRLDLALAVGAALAVQADELALHSIRNGGFDAAVDASGNPAAILEAMSLVQPGGIVVVTGMPTDPVAIDVARQTVLREVVLKGIYGRLIEETWREVSVLMPALTQELDCIVTHEFSLSEFKQAFEIAASAQAGKVEFTFGS